MTGFRIFLLLCVIVLFFACGKMEILTFENRNGLNYDMILIPEGEFIMGSSERKNLANGIFAGPERTVYVDAFYISKNETTNLQYYQFVDSGGYSNRKYWVQEGWDLILKHNLKIPREWQREKGKSYFSETERNNPLPGVNWYEAYAYSKFENMRLPTEAEWEKAARGTDAREYPWGNNFDKYRCNVKESGFGFTLPVGGFLAGASPYGVMDMCGNIEEWTSTVYVDKKGVAIKNLIIVKGGAWADSAVGSKTWSRHLGKKGYIPGYHYSVRLARSLISN